MPNDKRPVAKTSVKGVQSVPVNESGAAAKAQPVAAHKLDQQSDLSKFGDLIKPVPPTKNNAGEFSQTGPVWWLGLNNDQTHALAAVLATAGGASASFAPVIAAALGASIGYIELVNTIGGSNGVDINGVIGVEGLIVTPRVGGFYGDLIQAARLAVSGRTILDFLIIASHEVPALASALNLGVVATVLNLVESGTPFGWALAGALGLAVDLLGSEPDPNQHGHIWANRDEAKEWESFVLAKTGDGNEVSLLSWQGLFSAQMGGGGDVYANRPEVGDWETWTLIDNTDGTVSFKSFNGNYLSAEQGGGLALYSNRTAIGTWEKFHLVTLTGGRVALKSYDKGKFVSVQQ